MEEKKERVLHTRVPESLDEEIREHAANLGLSVSNLVRNVLQNALGLVGDIVADTADVARTTSGEKSAAPEGGFRHPGRGRSGRVLGWQEAILNVNAVCESCNAILAKGTRAAIGVVEGASARPIRCLGCIEEVKNESA
jgi:hypothetical protein